MDLRLIMAHTAGFLSAAILIASFQCKNSHKLIVMQLVANALYVLSLLLLGAFSGCIGLIISCARNLIIASKRPWARWKGWPWLLVCLNVIGTAFTWVGPLSLLPLIGVSSLTLANWTRNGRVIRIANFAVSSPVWIVYDIFTGSWFGIAAELFCMSSVVVSVIRYGWKALDIVEE